MGDEVLSRLGGKQVRVEVGLCGADLAVLSTSTKCHIIITLTFFRQLSRSMSMIMHFAGI